MATPTIIDQLIPTKELAVMFGVPYQTLMANVMSGKIASIQPGGKGGKRLVYLPEMKKFMKTYRPMKERTQATEVQPELVLNWEENTTVGELHFALLDLQKQVAAIIDLIEVGRD